MAFNGFVNSFTNSPIQPSDVNYLPVVFNGANTAIQLEWSFQNPATLYPFCQFILISGTGTNTYAINMPNALYSSTLQSCIIYNTGVVDITIYDFGGSTIGVCSPSIAYYIGNTDNSTEAGTWNVFIELGAGSSSVIAASLIDLTSNGAGEPNAGGLKAYANHLKINQYIFPYTGTAYVGNLSDLGNIVSYNASGSGTYELMSAASVSNGFITGFQNRSSGGGVVDIIYQSGDSLNGSTSTVLQMQVNESTYFVSDGVSNWYTFCYSANISYVISNITYGIPTSETATDTITVTIPQSAFQIQTFQTISGSATTVQVIYPNTITQQWFINNASISTLVLYLSSDSGNPTYKYTVLPGGTLTMFTDGTHLYNSPNFISNANIYLPNGLVTAPSLTFVNDTTTGIYRDTSTSAMAVTQGSTLVTEFKNTAITNSVPLLVPSGLETAPSIAFSSQISTGFYYETDTLSIAILGTRTTAFQDDITFSQVPINSVDYQQYAINIYSLMRAYE